MSVTVLGLVLAAILILQGILFAAMVYLHSQSQAERDDLLDRIDRIAALATRMADRRDVLDYLACLRDGQPLPGEPPEYAGRRLNTISPPQAPGAVFRPPSAPQGPRVTIPLPSEPDLETEALLRSSDPGEKVTQRMERTRAPIRPEATARTIWIQQPNGERRRAIVLEEDEHTVPSHSDVLHYKR